MFIYNMSPFALTHGCQPTLSLIISSVNNVLFKIFPDTLKEEKYLRSLDALCEQSRYEVYHLTA